MQLFEYPPVRYWSKEINGTLTGGPKKLFFLIHDIDVPPYDGRASGNLSIRGPEVPLGSPRVGTIHAQSPTPHARALPSVDTYQYRSSARHRAGAQVPQVFNPELSGVVAESLFRAALTDHLI